MFDLLKDIKDFLKVSPLDREGIVFTLHYKITSALLTALSILVSSKMYFFEAIQCLGDESWDGDKMKAVNSFCWIHSTYTVTSQLDSRLVGKITIYPGVGQLSSAFESVRYHRYYQWVPLVLFVQALFFLCPWFIWRSLERDQTKKFISHLKVFKTTEEFQVKTKEVTEYFVAGIGYHNWLAYQYVLCEFLNLVNIVCQVYFTDVFIDYGFTTLGLEVLKPQNPLHRIDPLALAFPKLTKCTFNKYGPSGQIVPFDFVCVLPMNNLNEKIYVVLWFWFFLLSVLTALNLVYRVVTVFLRFSWTTRLQCMSRITDSNKLALIATKCCVGDMFFLSLLGKNVDAVIFHEFLGEVAVKLESKRILFAGDGAVVNPHTTEANNYISSIERIDNAIPR